MKKLLALFLLASIGLVLVAQTASAAPKPRPTPPTFPNPIIVTQPIQSNQ